MKKTIEREIIIACILGDGCLVGYNNELGKKIYTTLTIKHSNQQYDYLYWKLDLLNSLQCFSKKGQIRNSKSRHKNGKVFNQKYITFNNSKYIRILGKWIYKNGIKTSATVLKYINSPIGLAIWFMDDGGLLRKKKKHKNGDVYFLKPSSKLCTHNFSYDENILISNHLEDVYGIKSSILKDKGYYYLYFNKDETLKIWNIIKEYVKDIPSMRKKFDLCIDFYEEDSF